jgi:hypothetical protein
MHTPCQIIVIPVPMPVASNGWLKGPKKAWPPKPRPSHWPPRQPIPSPAARQALQEARRRISERRAAATARNP